MAAIVYVQKALGCLACIHNIALITYHFYITCIGGRNNKLLSIQWIALFSLCTNVILSVLINLCQFIIYPISWFKYITISTLISWSWSRLSLYYFFLEQLFIISNNLNIQFTKRHKIISSYRLLMLLWAIFVTILLCYTSIPSSKYKYIILIIISLIDLLISLLVPIKFILFSRKITLNNLNVRARDLQYSHNSHLIQQNQRHYLLKKLLLLSLIVMITIHINMLLTIFTSMGTVFISLDSIINVWCILLTFSKYKFIYSKICGKLHNVIGCLSCYTFQSNINRVHSVTERKNTSLETEHKDSNSSDTENTIIDVPQLQRGSITREFKNGDSDTLDHLPHITIQYMSHDIIATT